MEAGISSLNYLLCPYIIYHNTYNNLKLCKQVISVVPQMQFFKLDPHWEFVVVGSDGVWDAMSNQEVSNYIKVNMYKS